LKFLLTISDDISHFSRYAKHAISIRTGGVLPIEECKNARSAKNDPNHWLTLCIEEPFDLTNTARSAYDGDIFLKIKDVFFHSWFRLKESCDLQSVFKDPLFINQQPQYTGQIGQMKYMIPGGSGAPAMASVNDVKS
jgi:Cid1 family poly A polymerase